MYLMIEISSNSQISIYLRIEISLDLFNDLRNFV